MTAKDPAEWRTGAQFSGTISTDASGTYSLLGTNVGEASSLLISCVNDGAGSATLTYKHAYTVSPLVFVTAVNPSGMSAYGSICLTVGGRTTTTVDVYATQAHKNSTVKTMVLVMPNMGLTY